MKKIKIILGDGTEWIKECETQEEAEQTVEEIRQMVGDKGRVTVLQDVSK